MYFSVVALIYTVKIFPFRLFSIQDIKIEFHPTHFAPAFVG